MLGVCVGRGVLGWVRLGWVGWGETPRLRVDDRSVTRSYYRGAAGALLCYDITRCGGSVAVRPWGRPRWLCRLLTQGALVFRVPKHPVCSRESYNNVANWLADARSLASPDIVIILVGNKGDLERDRQVTYLEASRFAQDNGTPPPARPRARATTCACDDDRTFLTSRHLTTPPTLSLPLSPPDVMFLETSAATGEGVDEVFLKNTRSILTKIETGTHPHA